ncbi:glycosyltransferase family 4 protein [Bdellovibrionales bacterium]|nr:glycosyltransferase family 4 protein [Bdellovibrionales bacterium]
MKIWITELGEPLPMEKNIRLHRYGEFSRYFAQQGHDVTWWTSNFSHAPKRFVVPLGGEFNHGEAKVRVIPGLGYKKNVSLARIKHQSDFANKFYELACSEDKPDILISPVPTIEVAYKAACFSQKLGVPLLVDIRDLWPDELTNIAPKPVRPLAKVFLSPLYKKMEFVCNTAASISGVSQSYLNYGLKFAGRVQSEQDFVFPLGYKRTNVAESELEKARIWLKDLGVRESEFNICFIGTIGKFFNIDTVIDVADSLKNTNAKFIIAGDGSSMTRLKKKSRGMENVLFPGWINAPQIQAIMSVSRVGLAPYVEGSFMSLPNKPFEYMSHGLPIVSSIQHELKEFLKNYNCGYTYHADSRRELASALTNLMDDEENRIEMGKNSFSLYEEMFSLEKVFKSVELQLDKIVSAFNCK